MVATELSVKDVVDLSLWKNIDEKKTKDLLSKFSLAELVEYILSTTKKLPLDTSVEVSDMSTEDTTF